MINSWSFARDLPSVSIGSSAFQKPLPPPSILHPESGQTGTAGLPRAAAGPGESYGGRDKDAQKASGYFTVRQIPLVCRCSDRAPALGHRPREPPVRARQEDPQVPGQGHGTLGRVSDIACAQRIETSCWRHTSKSLLFVGHNDPRLKSDII